MIKLNRSQWKEEFSFADEKKKGVLNQKGVAILLQNQSLIPSCFAYLITELYGEAHYINFEGYCDLMVSLGAFKNNKKTKKLLLEMQQRTGDYNIGGMARKKIITAYKEKALELCCVLQQKGEISYAFLRKNNVTESHIKMLGTNVYQWYERVSRGVYRLSEEGKKALEQKEYKEVVAYYQKKWKSV